MPSYAPRAEFTITNRQAVIANLHSTYPAIKRRAIVANREVAEVVRARAYALAAVDTGFMRDHLKTFFSEQGLTFRVGWLKGDFLGAGLAFYPPYLEFGTSNAPAQPALLPASREGKALMKLRMRMIVKEEIRRRSSR